MEIDIDEYGSYKVSALNELSFAQIHVPINGNVYIVEVKSESPNFSYIMFVNLLERFLGKSFLLV